MQYTSLKSYKLKKGKFISPWNELATPMEDNKSWTYGRLPEYLWVGLVFYKYGRTEGLRRLGVLMGRLSKVEGLMNILVRQSRLSGFIRATVPVIGSHQKCYAAKGSLHE